MHTGSLPSTDTKFVLLDTAKIEVYKDMLKHSDIPITIGAVSPCMPLLCPTVQVPHPQFVGFGRYGHTELPMRMYQNQHMGSQFQI